MRIFNRDGTPGYIGGNGIRCVAKYLYDKGIVRKENITIETAGGQCSVRVYTRDGLVTSASVNLGKAILAPEKIPTTLPGDRVVDRPVTIGGKEYRITCCNVGNPHCVVFCDKIDTLDLNEIGPLFERADIFPQRVNAEFVRVVNSGTIKMRVYERGTGETYSCGTGACAAVIAAVENGLLEKGRDITVKVKGGDLTVNYTDEAVILTGDAVMVCEGTVEI